MNDAKQFLENASPLLRSRLMRAVENQSDATSLLHDPIEDEAKTRAVIAQAETEAADALREYSQQFGFCHLLWKNKQRILKEKYGIDWVTPAQINPGVIFD